jgi:hypothetical protein
VKKPVKLPAVEPWKPTEWEPADVAAIQALVRGDASPEQQRRAVDYIINDIAGTYDMSYRPDSERDSVFAEGKRYVGLQLVKAVNLNLARIRQAKSKTPQEQA